MYLIYSVLLTIGFALSLPFYLWKGRGSGRYFRTFLERMKGPGDSLKADGRSFWIHAVSVGEVLAARALIAPLKERFPDAQVFVSATTITGHAVARSSLRGVDGVFYAPFDWVGPVRRTLRRLRPELLVLMETEIWPNLIHEAKQHGARVALVNGRLSPRSFSRYRRIRAFMARVLSDVDLFLMQGEAHAQRVRELGAPAERVRVLGNLKFDAVEAPPLAGLASLFARRHGAPVWVAGSTVAGEEEMVLSAYRRVREQIPQAGLIMAPRHPERFAEVPPLVEAAGFRCVRRSALGPEGWQNGSVVLLDTLGELAQVYPFAAVVFVGGSLVPAGGHNILEAAMAGKAVVVGPHMENFQEIAEQFRSDEALAQVHSAEDLAQQVLSLLTDDVRRERMGAKARALVARNRGGVRATVHALAGLVG